MTAVDRKYKARITVAAANIGSGGVSHHVCTVTEDSFLTSCSEAITSGGTYAMQSDAGDVIFTEDGTAETQLACDVVKCSLDTTPGNSLVRFNIEEGSYSASAANYRWIHWGHATTQSQPARTATYGRDAVYETDCVCYVPFFEGSGSTAYDRTSYATDWTLYGDTSFRSGGGIDVDGVSDYIQSPSTGTYATITGDISHVIRLRATDISTMRSIIGRYNSYWRFIGRLWADNSLGFDVCRNGYWSWEAVRSSANAVSPATTFTYGNSRGGTTGNVYLNGSSIASATQQYAMASGGSTTAAAMAAATSTEEIEGEYYAIIAFKRSLSTAEHDTFHNNLSSTTFAVVGSRQSEGASGSPWYYNLQQVAA